MTPSTIYWITRLDYFRSLCTTSIAIGTLLTFLTFITFLIVVGISDDSRSFEFETALRKVPVSLKAWYRRILYMFAAMIILPLIAKPFIPTTKEMCAIQIIPVVANSEEMGKLRDMGSDVLTLASDWLKEQVEQRKAK